MKRTLSVRRALTVLPVALALLLVMGALAGSALAESGGMAGMPGMTDEEMSAMSGGASGEAQDGHAAQAADAHGDGGAGTAQVNWVVIGGFIVLIAGSTLAAVILKRHLRRRMLTGELALAGVKDV